MPDSFDLHKQRDIVFSTEPPGQIARAYQILSGLPNCKTEYSNTENALRVSYSLRHYTLEGLEEGLIKEGFQLNRSPLHSITRQVIYYCEDTTCHNLNIPSYPTKKNEREVFVKAYGHEPHGDRDDTPPELRDYR
jgi:hypothetical protein